jgi:hypothetical protein
MDFSIGSGGVSTQNILRVDGVGGCELDIYAIKLAQEN